MEAGTERDGSLRAALVLAGVPRARLDADLTGTVVDVDRNGRTPIPPGGAVLQARGDRRPVLLEKGPVGTAITVRLDVPELQAVRISSLR